MSDTVPLSRGAFTLSLDFELIWGSLDLAGPKALAPAVRFEREVVIERLLLLLEEFEIPSTWLVLGHLFLGRCDKRNGIAHPEIVRPRHAWHPDDWFRHDPCASEGSAPLFYGRSLVERIAGSRVPQEIGAHSFSHVIFGDPGCSRDTAEGEVTETLRAAGELGLRPRSFAFPRNSVGHLDVLARHGFTCYRGPGLTWYERGGIAEQGGRARSRRLAHIWDVALARTPPVVLPEREASGLWNLPGSMIYFPMHGVRRYVPLSRRVKRALRGLEAAERTRRVFHLWFHPTNLAAGSEAMFLGLRQILGAVRALREQGRIEVLGMGGVVAKAQGEELAKQAVLQ